MLVCIKDAELDEQAPDILAAIVLVPVQKVTLVTTFKLCAKEVTFGTDGMVGVSEINIDGTA